MVPVAPLPGQNLQVEPAKDTFVAQWADGTTVDLPVDTVDVAVTQAGVDAAVRDVATPRRVGERRGDRQERCGRDAARRPDRQGPELRAGRRRRAVAQYNVEAATAILSPQLAGTETKPKDAQISLSSGSPR